VFGETTTNSQTGDTNQTSDSRRGGPKDFAERQKKLSQEFEMKKQQLQDEFKKKQQQIQEDFKTDQQTLNTQRKEEMMKNVCEMRVKRKAMMGAVFEKFDKRLDEIVARVGTNVSKVENFEALLADAKAKRDALRAAKTALGNVSITCNSTGQQTNNGQGDNPTFRDFTKAMREYYQSVAKLAAAIRRAHVIKPMKSPTPSVSGGPVTN
jgi:hypothetical protein